eukprot:2000583-Prymnesium_polylepis.1
MVAARSCGSPEQPGGICSSTDGRTPSFSMSMAAAAPPPPTARSTRKAAAGCETCAAAVVRGHPSGSA